MLYRKLIASLAKGKPKQPSSIWHPKWATLGGYKTVQFFIWLQLIFMCMYIYICILYVDVVIWEENVQKLALSWRKLFK
jgi:hypothetical protein